MAYTTIDDPSAYFQTALYTGNGSTQSIVNDGNSDLQPDWIWLKGRDIVSDNGFVDSSRGNTKVLISNTTAAEVTSNGGSDITSFNTDGFSVGSSHQIDANTNTKSILAWQWKANGGTTSSNSDGDITSTVQANTTAGFSIVTYTGNGTNGAYVGHGLGATPDIVIIKNRSAAKDWRVGFRAFTNDLVLNDTSAGAAYSDGRIGDLLSDKFELGGTSTYGSTNTSGENYVAYVFTSIQGYSKIGSFTGNGNADGPFVYTGFKPAWLMYKEDENAGGWGIWDNKRVTYNPINIRVLANTNAADDTSNDNRQDFLSNGFKVRTSSGGFNESGRTIYYMAFAEHPFVSSKGVPTTAR